MVASGLCHSDDHIATGDIPVGIYPFAGGHEGAGIVESVGPNTKGFEVGDKVVFSFLPACGKCRWCATGHSNLCDLGAGPARRHPLGRPDRPACTSRTAATSARCAASRTFSEYTTVAVDSAIKVPQDTKLEVACLLGCSVGTGWGSAVNTAEVQPGDTVIIQGIGGIGTNAVQGAAHAGAANVIAVDPRRVQAREGPGARRHRTPSSRSRRPPSSPRASPTARAPTSRSSPSASPSPSTSARPSPRSASRARSSSPASATSPRSACRSRSAS